MKTSDVFKSISIVAGLAGAVLGALAIAAAVSGRALLPAYPSGATPVAPFGSAAVLCFGLGLLAVARWPQHPTASRAVAIAMGAVAALALLSLASHLIGRDPDPLSFFRATRPLGGIQILLAAVSLLLTAVQRAPRVAGVLGFIVTSAGAVIILGYIYGGGLTGEQPAPISSALASLAVGTGLVTAGGETGWPNRALLGDSVSAILLRWMVPLIVAVVVVTDLATNLVFSRVGRAAGSALNTVVSVVLAVAIITYLSGIIARRLERANADLRESERRFTRVFKSVPVAVIVSRVRDRQILEVNDEFVRMFGYPQAEAVGRSAVGLGLWKNLEARQAVLATIEAAGGDVRETEVTLHHQDGHPVLCRMSIQVIEVQGEQILISSAADITGRKRAEEALRLSEAKFSSIFRESPVALAVTERGTGQFIEVNDAYLRHVGAVTREQILGKTTLELGLLTEETRARLRASVTEGHAQGLMVPARNLRGEARVTEMSISGYTAEGNDYILSSVVDVSARLELERQNRAELAERRRVQQRLDLALEAGRIGVWELNPATRAYRFDQRLLELFGLAVSLDGTVPYAEWAACVDPPDLVHLEALLAHTLAGKGTVAAEFRIVSADGKERYILGNATLQPGDGERPTVVVGINIDITDRKRAELQLREYQAGLEQLVEARTGELRAAKDAAEGASRAKGAFLAHMSHEIRTPMNAILGYAQLLQGDAALMGERRRKVEAIRSSGDHLLGLLNDVLEMSRIEAGSTTLSEEPFDLHSLVDGLRSMFTGLAHQRGVAFEVELSPGLARGVRGDPGKVRQVLINLLGNALKFTDQGRITLRLSSRPIGSEGCEVSATVQDTGPGIPLSDHELIFASFGQSEAGRQRRGTGLGLAISRSFARLMGGNLTVESRPGEGSAFHFTFPCRFAGAELPSEARPLNRSLRLDAAESRRRVLVVDDVESNRDVLQEMLARGGFETRCASSGEEALVAHAEWAPNVVLMDLHMPGMGGLAAIRHLRASGSSASIVVTTAAAGQHTPIEVEQAGANALMQKPFREAVLLEMIASAIGARLVEVPVPSARPESPPSVPLGELVAGLPADVVQDLRDACRQARVTRILNLADRVAGHSEVAAQLIRELASEFRYGAILRALDSA